MVDFRTRPWPEGLARNRIASSRRASASDYSSAYAAVPTDVNADEADLEADGFGTSFTKGLAHDEFGQVADPAHYIAFVNQINQQDAENFDRVPRGIGGGDGPRARRAGGEADGSDIAWRGWESPRAGHYFDLQGPDPDAVGMPPAPELGSEELTAEMAEVYALALLRDVPFTDIADPAGGASDPGTGIAVADVLAAMESLSWFSDASGGGLTLQQRRRRAARRLDPLATGDDSGYDVDDPPDGVPFDRRQAFRGSAPAAKAGPYVSQFMLLGKLTPSNAPHTDSSVPYGRQVIDQKIETLEPGTDFMVRWNAYLDVQSGADFRGDTDARVMNTRRFIATPRDLAAYVRYDALYQAYLNACLYMLAEPTHFAAQRALRHPYTGELGPGFPDGNRGSTSDVPESRQAFAQFGGPHILSLVTEVATRCLKAVRRQKFNYHRRARPERLGALLTLKGSEGAGADDRSGELGDVTSSRLGVMMGQAGFSGLLALVAAHNAARVAANAADPHLDASAAPDPGWFAAADNFLLPMAFAEGSPMHPSYGAGHASVAGGCVTMLKAFFATTDEDGAPLPWPASLPALTANADGSALIDAPDRVGMTIGGELNKLAANISIGRDMAGVHFYTDYYESLRMGERIATGMLIEQMKHYNEPLELGFESFDGDRVHLLKNDFDAADPRVFVHDARGRDVGIDAWWHRHQTGESVAEARAIVRAVRTGRPEAA